MLDWPGAFTWGNNREMALARAIPAVVIQGAFVHAMCRRFEPDPLTDEQALDGMIDFCLHGLVA